jgi:Transposase and inactivated derivatives
MLALNGKGSAEAHKINGVNWVMKTQSDTRKEPSFIGIDYHKRYSVYCVVDVRGEVLERGRIEHVDPGAFAALVKRWAGCRVVFEASMNWHWLYEILEKELAPADIMLANPYKTRIIAEAQVKTDKVDAMILAQLLRGNLISSVHIGSKENRQRKEVLRQRAFFVRQRTMLRNRIHRLLGGQHEVKLPQCSDLFGKKGVGFLEALELPAPAGLLLRQQLDMLRNLQVRIREDEKVLEAMLVHTPALERVRSLPGMGLILAAVVVSEIDDIGRFPSAQKLCGYAGLCPSTSSSGGKTFNGKLMTHCNKWLRWGFVEAAWVAVGCSAYFGDFYKSKRTLGKKPNTAILATARRMARIAWQLLTEQRTYTSFPMPQEIRRRPARRHHLPAGSAKEMEGSIRSKIRTANLKKRLSPVAPNVDWLVAESKA